MTRRRQHFGRIDHVLANAGIASYGTVRQIDDASFARVVDININGVYRTLHASIPHLEKTKGYALVVASLASFTNLAGLASYNASKAGAESLALATKQEVAFLGIDIGVCHPSWIDTDIVRGAEADLPTFRAIRKKLPYPANSTTTLEECVDGILDGFAKRKARVYVPKGVVLANFTKPLVNSVLVWPIIRRVSGKQVRSLEADVDEARPVPACTRPADQGARPRASVSARPGPSRPASCRTSAVPWRPGSTDPRCPATSPGRRDG